MTRESAAEGRTTAAGTPADRADPAIVLDDAIRRAAIDQAGMLDAIAGLPAQLRGAAARATTIAEQIEPLAVRPRSVIVLGMGGSAIGADLVRGSFADRLRVPVVVQREPTLPAWADRETLVVASSHSGRTEETLRAFAAVVERGLPAVAITTGGRLAELARAAGAPVVAFEAPGQPRAAVGHGAGLLLGVLVGAGVLDVDPVAELASAAAAADAQLESGGPSIPFAANRAKQLAATIADRLVIVLGADHLQAVARRWKTQLNENAKVWADWDEFPELNHNSVVGFGGPAWTSERLFVLPLAGAGEAVRVAERRAAALEVLRESATDAEVVELPPLSPFGQSFAGVMLGDLVSVYLALLRGVDPTPVEAIARLKVRLGAGPSGV